MWKDRAFYLCVLFACMGSPCGGEDSEPPKHCGAASASCSSGSDCCSGACSESSHGDATCFAIFPGKPCTESDTCLNGYCRRDGTCGQARDGCGQPGTGCSHDFDCCGESNCVSS